MANGIVKIPTPVNEPVLGYAPGSPERASLERTATSMAPGELASVTTVFDYRYGWDRVNNLVRIVDESGPGGERVIEIVTDQMNLDVIPAKDPRFLDLLLRRRHRHKDCA